MTNYIYYIYIKGVLNSPFILSNNIHEKADGLEIKEWRFKQKDFVSIVEKSIQKAVCCAICRRAKREAQSLLKKKEKEYVNIFRLLLLENIKKIIG